MAMTDIDEARVYVLLVTEPVRSGQRLYARSRDVVVTSTVGAGAEVIITEVDPTKALEAVMDGLGHNSKGITAPVNFTVPMSEKPYSYNYDPGPGVALRNTREEEHGIPIRDGRGLERVPGAE